MDSRAVAIAVEGFAQVGNQFVLPFVDADAVLGPGGFDLTQFREPRGVDFTVDPQLAQGAAAVEQFPGPVVDFDADLHAGAAAVGADQGVDVDRVGHHFRARRREVDVFVEQGQIVFGNSGQRRVGEYRHVQNAVHPLDTVDSEQIVVQPVQFFEFGPGEQLAVRDIGDDDELADAIAVFHLAEEFPVGIVFQQQGIRRGVQPEVLGEPGKEGNDERGDPDDQPGSAKHQFTVESDSP